jgi:murein DD-endopeptidase MepM/ murein hydrolase activator NlpD
MWSLLPRPIRVHGRAPLVVAVSVVVALHSLARPADASGAPVDPVPVGVWPLQPEPEVVRAFDPPDSPFGAGHRGVDLAGRLGQVVHTALPGRVTFASGLAGRGVVVVDHGPTRTTYEPVAATVRVGDVLARGQPIGTLELGGSHCLPAACLHWGWLRGQTYLDPLLLVGGGPVVLLPLWRAAPVRPTAAVGLAAPRADVGWRSLPYSTFLAHLETLRRSATATGRAPPTARSGAGMGLSVGRAQPVGADVRVELGGRQ